MHRFHGYFTHLYGKFQRNVIYFLLFIFFVGGFLTSEYLTKQDLKKIDAEKSQLKTILAEYKTNVSQPTNDELTLYSQKEKAIQTTEASLVVFSYKITSLTPTKKEIVVQIQGSPSMKLDAADLTMKLSDNLKIITINPGQAFQSYPRKSAVSGEITVSGVTSFTDNSVVFGQANKPFVTLVVEKTVGTQQKEYLTIDEKNTKVYFQGVSVLDMERSMKQIEL